jgi:hypothetical protein
MPKRRKPFTRIRNPKKLIPTEATTELLLGIYHHEGVLSQTQIVREYFSGSTKSWPEYRLQQYFDHRLLNKFNAEWVNGEHLKETVYTLGTMGARYLARHLEIDYTSFTYRSKPRWLTLSHDLKLNDFRFSVVRESKKLTGFELVRWISEFELHQHNKFLGRPDGFFMLQRPSPTHADRVEELAILVEMDNATHPLNRFVSRKVKPSLRYIGSKEYERVFGVSNGAYFVVTTGPKRLANLKAKTEAAGGSGRFYFTTFDQTDQGVLTNAIWQMAGSNELLSIADMPLKPRLRSSMNHSPQHRITVPVLAT